MLNSKPSFVKFRVVTAESKLPEVGIQMMLNDVDEQVMIQVVPS